MMRRIPILATLVVLAAVAVMIALGLWQLERMHEKEGLLAGYEKARVDAALVSFPRDAPDAERVLYRRSRIDCAEVLGRTTKSGLDGNGVSGIAHYATCRLADGGTAEVVLGWSRDPALREWGGGPVSGLIAPGPRLVADPPLAGLEASAKPDPRDLPNNHWSYAVQWFLFALTALVIYGLAVWKRMRG